jgi:hypothetical protein
VHRPKPDAHKRQEHWHILGNARALDAPGGAKAWLGDDFARVDAIMARNLDNVRDALERAKALAPTPPDHTNMVPAANADAPTPPYSVPFDDADDEPIEWVRTR